MSIVSRTIVLAAVLMLAAEPAWSYVGPGAGLSLLTAFWALLVAVVSALAFLVMWPLRARLRRRKAERDTHMETRTEAGTESASR